MVDNKWNVGILSTSNKGIRSELILHQTKDYLQSYLIVYQSTNNSNISDLEIVSEVNNGNEAVYDNMYRQYFTSLVRYARAYKGVKAEDSEDLVQGVFLKIWKNHKTWKPTEIKSYLYEAVKNASINLSYKRTHDKKLADAIGRLDTEHTYMSTDHETLATEFQLVFQAGVDLLSSKDREIYTLYAEQNLSASEISRKISLSKSAVNQRITGIRQHLNHHLARLGWPDIYNGMVRGRDT